MPSPIPVHAASTRAAARAITVALLLATFACSADEPRTVAAPTSAEPGPLPVVRTPRAPLTEVERGVEPVAPAVEGAIGPDLSALLRLPAGTGAVDRVAERLKRGVRAPDPEEKRRPLRLELREESQAQGLVSERKRAGVGASADVAESTTLRGGVQVDRETGRDAEAPVPTVGVEVRF